MKGKGPSEIALFVFRQSQSQSLLEGLGFTVRDGVVHDADGSKRRFFCCGKPADVKHLGRVMPGSLELICEDIICFNRYATTLVTD